MSTWRELGAKFHITQNESVREERYPLRYMKPGDSFVVKDMSAANSARTALYNMNIRRKKRGIESRLRLVARKNGDGSYRVWMVEKDKKLAKVKAIG